MEINIDEIIISAKEFLDRQNIVYDETELRMAIVKYLTDYIAWDTIKHDMYEMLFEKFE